METITLLDSYLLKNIGVGTEFSLTVLISLKGGNQEKKSSTSLVLSYSGFHIYVLRLIYYCKPFHCFNKTTPLRNHYQNLSSISTVHLLNFSKITTESSHILFL